MPDLLDITRLVGSTSSIGSFMSEGTVVVATNVPCRITPAQQLTSLGERSQPIDVDKYTIRMPKGTDIQKRDFVTIQGSGLKLEIEFIKLPRSWDTLITAQADIAS